MVKGLILLDTSVMLEILRVPGKSEDISDIPDKFDCLMTSNEYFFYLPVATVIETGNHIAQIKMKGGNIRRIIAQNFIAKVTMALEGTTPFKTLSWEAKEMLQWIDEFPNYAAQSSGFGDLSIIKQYEKLCRTFPSELPVKIWSCDKHLAGYCRNWPEET